MNENATKPILSPAARTARPVAAPETPPTTDTPPASTQDAGGPSEGTAFRTSSEVVKLFEALCAAQAIMKPVQKSGENTFDHYRFAGLNDFIDVVRAPLAESGLFAVATVAEIIDLADRPTRNGGVERAVRLRMVLRIGHTSGQWMEISGWGEGQDRADKAIYKAETGARKYLLAKAFSLASTDDPESESQEPPPRENPKEVARKAHAVACAQIVDRAFAAGMSDADLTRAFAQAMGKPVEHWRTLTEHVLSFALTDVGWAKLANAAQDLVDQDHPA